jgi:DNA polymerase-3 subunit delta'
MMAAANGFDPTLVGHWKQRERLLARIEAEKLPGSLLFTGMEGLGKRRVAMELAMRELCFRRSACGECEGCRAFQGDFKELPNFLRIAPEGKAGVIRIGAIRADDIVEGGVIAWAHRAPPPRCHRWIMVEDAHRLNGPSANILLKTLEEPPPGTHFILVTHRPDVVLQTIRSRCERIAFQPLEDQEAWSVARREGWGETDRDCWTALAGGSFRLLDPGDFARAMAQLEAWLDLMEGKPFAGPSEALLPDKDAAQAQSEQLRQPLEILLALLTDLARLGAGRAPALAPWRARLAAVSLGQDPRVLQELIYTAQRNLMRNPVAESMLRELALALHG